MEAGLRRLGFNTMADKLSAAGLFSGVLSGDADMTLFAPTDTAFNSLSQPLQTLLAAHLETVMKNHIVPGTILTEYIISNGSGISNLNGNELNAVVNDYGTTVGDAVLVMTKTNLPVLSMTVHTVDNVILEGL